MARDKDPSQPEKKHKRHNSMSEKLRKKHELKKNKRKFKEERSKYKSLKKHKEQLKKLKLASEGFYSKVTPEEIDMVRKVIAKLIAHSHNSIAELPQLFDMLDGGFEVDLSGLQDEYVMAKLNKAFKCLRLKRDETNKLEFRKREGVHDFKLRPFIQHFIDEAVGAGKKGEEAEGDSDDGSEYSDSESISSNDKKKKKRGRSSSSDNSNSSSSSSDKKNKLKRKQPEQAKLEDLNSKINKLQYQQQEERKKNVQEESDSDSSDSVGPKLEGGASEFLQSTLSLINKPDEEVAVAPSKQLEDELNRMFAGAPTKRVKGPQLPPGGDQELDSKKYLGAIDKKLTEEEEQQRQAAIGDYMNDYNEHFRQKSLLEEHQERARSKKSSDKRSHQDKLKQAMGKSFDHERDIKYGGIDSQKAFQAMSKNNLDKKFGGTSRYL